MSKQFALDLGTTKFCLAACEIDSQKSPEVQIITVPATGMRRGMLSDFNQVSAGLEGLIKTAEGKLDCDIRQVVIGIAGSHLSSYLHSEIFKIGPQQIAAKDLRKFQILAKDRCAKPGREILHIVPISYQIDGRQPIENPIHQTGHHLSATYFVLDSDHLYLRDVIKSVNQAGLEVVRMYAEPFASGSVTVPHIAKELGLAVCDIGGGTTDGMVYTGGMPRRAFTINIGGVMMTRDIAICLQISETEAEKAKSFFGLSPEKTNLYLDLKDVNGNTKRIYGKDIQHILGHRVVEWSTLVAEALESYRGQLGAGLLLTGGGSMLANLAQVLNYQFKIPVRVSHPQLGYLKQTEHFAVTYATVLGLINLEAEAASSNGFSHSNPWRIPFIRNITQWIREFS